MCTNKLCTAEYSRDMFEILETCSLGEGGSSKAPFPLQMWRVTVRISTVIMLPGRLLTARHLPDREKDNTSSCLPCHWVTWSWLGRGRCHRTREFCARQLPWSQCTVLSRATSCCPAHSEKSSMKQKPTTKLEISQETGGKQHTQNQKEHLNGLMEEVQDAQIRVL